MARNVAAQSIMPTQPAQPGVILLACACLASDDPTLVWAPFRGRPLFAWSLLRYAQTLPDAPITLLVDGAHLSSAHELCETLGLSRVILLAVGEQTRRRDAIANGLAALAANHPSCEWVIIHEATRPLVTSHLILDVLERAREAHCSAVASEPVKETLKRVRSGGGGQPDLVAETLPRERLARAQTPQVFRAAELAQALAALPADADPPDEATSAFLAGLPLLAVPGDHTNLRVTSQADLPILAALVTPGPLPPASAAAPEPQSRSQA